MYLQLADSCSTNDLIPQMHFPSRHHLKEEKMSMYGKKVIKQYLQPCVQQMRRAQSCFLDQIDKKIKNSSSNILNAIKATELTSWRLRDLFKFALNS